MNKLFIVFVMSCVSLFITMEANANPPIPITTQSDIEGDWIGEGKFKVRITRNGDGYQGKIIWIKPGEETKDVKNENKNLRSRDLVGITMLDGFRYSSASKKYTGGSAYLFPRGKTMTNTVLWVEGNQLKMKISLGLMSKTMSLTRA